MKLWSFLFKKPSQRKQAKKQQTESNEKVSDTSGQASDLQKSNLHRKLKDNINYIKQQTGNSSDIVVRQIEIGKKNPIQAAIIFTDGLIDDAIVNESILNPLISISSNSSQARSDTKIYPKSLLDKFEKQLLPIANVSIVTDWEDLFSKLLLGEAIIFLDGVNQGLAASTRGGEQRSILQPESEVTLRGPRDSFTESISTNTSLVRRRINNPNLWLESMKIGKVSQTDVGIMYINGIANEKIVKEVKERLKRIDIDQINDSGEIEQFIEDDPYSVFPTTVHTERPDVVAANLMEGKVAIFVNGSPYAITVPTLFIEFFHAADDYYSRFDIALALRFLRIAIFFIALITPSAYVAITTYHQEMIPTILIIAIAAQREAVPFPAFFEALLMEVTFEILREAGVRLPRPVGSAVSIVGALVIGQAAIQAKIVSPAMVIIVSITAIANFALPSFSIAISTRLIRFILMTLAAVMGFYGVTCGLMIMILHLCSLRSFGIPYMAPLAPLMGKNMGDSFIRAPLWMQKTRPKLIASKNIIRVGENQKPGPHQQSSTGDQNET